MVSLLSHHLMQAVFHGSPVRTELDGWTFLITRKCPRMMQLSSNKGNTSMDTHFSVTLCLTVTCSQKKLWLSYKMVLF